MVTITASFKQNSDAVAAVNALKSAGFLLGPEMPLPIDTEFTVSAEQAVSPGAEDSGMTATTGAAIGGILGVIAGLTLTPLVGPAGATFMVMGALLSLIGWFGGGMVATPRLTFAMAEARVLPAAFGRLHARYRTPAFSIVVLAVVSMALALSGGFLSNLTLSVATRLVVYLLVCGSVPILRARDGHANAAPPARFRLPAVGVFWVAGCAFSLAMATRMSQKEFWILLLVVGLASGNWYLSRRRRPA